MKKISLSGLAAGLLLVGLVGTAGAASITDTTLFTATGTNDTSDYISHGRGDVNFLDGTLDWVRWQHQYAFDPPLGAITSATLELSFRDDSDGGVVGADEGVLFWKDELGFGYTEGGDWDLGEIDTGTYAYNVGLTSLGDGVFKVTVCSLWGDFYLDKSVLTINYDAAPVPEPATMLLLGTGLAGLAGLRRKEKA